MSEEHRRPQQSACENDDRYRTLFESIDEGFCIIEVVFGNDRATDYRFLEVNSAFESDTGLREATGKSMRSLAPDHEEYWFQIYGDIASSRQPRRFTRQARALDDRWYDVYAFPIDEPTGTQVAILFRDVTQRVRTEEELRRAHGLIEGITAGTRDLIAAEDQNFRYIYFNEAYQEEFRKLWGQELAEGSSMLEALAPWPEEQLKAKALWSRALAGETFSITKDFGPSEKRRHVYDFRFSPIHDTDGRIIGAAHTLRDVTQQVEFQRALRESEERYRLITRATNDVIWDWDLEANIIEWNEAAVSRFGWQPDQLHGPAGSWYDNIHPDDVDHVMAGIRAAIDSGRQSWSDEYRFRRSDGSYAVFLDRGYIAHDDSGKAYRMIGSMVDLTERRQAEEALRRVAAADAFRVTLTDALRPLEDPVQIQMVASLVLGQHLRVNRVHYGEISADGRVGTVHADYHASTPSVVGSYDLSDYSPEVLREFREGHTIIISDATQDARLDPVDGSRERHPSSGAYVVVPLIKGGRAVAAFIVNQAEPRAWTEAEVALIEETAERTWAAVERAHIEKALRESEQRFRLLTDGIPHMVWLMDGDGRFEFLNRQFTSYTGAAFEPFEARAFINRFVHPDDTAGTLSAWESAVREQQPFFFEHRIRSASGTYNWFAARAEPQIDKDSGKILRWFGTMTNVQDRKLAEQTLREADRQKDEFLAMLAHELRNPLAAVRNVERLLEPRTAGDPAAERLMAILRRQTGTLGELVEELLDVSRITRGLVELKQEPVALRHVVDHALESVQVLMDEKGHRVAVDMPVNPPTVLGDPVRLEQILVNLLTNAAKYTDPGGRVLVTVETAGEQVQLRVRDSGIGMTAEELDRVFVLFGQAERGLDRAQGGLGIGLTIVKNLVELHGGAIEAHSDGLGCGAEFVVTLPWLSETESTTAQAESLSSDSGRGKQILLVEDNADVAQTLEMLLQTAGHQVRVARDGHSALGLAAEFEPDIILLDIGLPGMDGYELARHLRQKPLTRGAIMAALTGYGQPDDKARAEAAGFDAHFVKPLDFPTLEAFISTSDAPVA